MRSLVLALALAVLLVGCSETSSPAEERCSPLRGTYVIHYEQRFSGGCGPIADVTVLYGDNGQSEGETPAPGQTCNEPTTYSSPNGCEGGFAVKCAANDGSWQSKETISITGAPGSTTATGTYDLVVTGEGACESSYGVTWKRK